MRFYISWALFGYISNLEIIVPFDSDNVAVCFRRNRAGVTKFSTRGGVNSVLLFPRRFALGFLHDRPGLW
jgi:hypothetical protein